jgi:DNA (cytosine-5)-methyltransferase 1
MGFPDNYTDIPKARPTNRYQGVGNSWAVPVIKWLGNRILNISHSKMIKGLTPLKTENEFELFDISGSQMPLMTSQELNGTEIPENPIVGKLLDVIDVDAPEKFYISPVGCKGILRRKVERDLTINPRLEEVLKSISSLWSDEKIEAISRVQSRGRFSTPNSLLSKDNEFVEAEY